MNMKDYLKTKRPAVLLYVLALAVLCVSFALYRLPLAAVCYPMGLVGVLTAVFLLLGYRREVKRTAEIQALKAKIARLEQQLRDSDQNKQEALDYFSVWAHQIKTPIAAMRLELQAEDSAVSRRLGAELGRIERYADMVMTYLRLGASSTDYLFRTLELDDVVRGAVRKFSGEFIARRLTLEYRPLCTQVLSDEKWLGFVLEQILSNALKYTRSGSITISLEEPKTLCISDTGMGIAPEDLPRIFDQGFTGYNGRTDRKASGIGLYLCRRICNALGHRISASSQVGVGTTIRIDLESRRIEGE